MVARGEEFELVGREDWSGSVLVDSLGLGLPSAPARSAPRSVAAALEPRSSVFREEVMAFRARLSASTFRTAVVACSDGGAFCWAAWICSGGREESWACPEDGGAV